jgi:enoyl-CoA hydratase
MFCSGMDLRAFAEGEGESILFGEHGFAGFVRRARKKPIVAAVHGAALAGGFELMLACDLVVATESCRFGLPEAKRGLIAGGGGALRLARALPRAIANEILLLGEHFDALTARHLGLVNRLVADEEAVQAGSLSMAMALAENAPLSIAANLAMVNAASGHDAAADWSLSNRLLGDLVNSADALEGARAFAEKRPANWRGQ